MVVTSTCLFAWRLGGLAALSQQKHQPRHYCAAREATTASVVKTTHTKRQQAKHAIKQNKLVVMNSMTQRIKNVRSRYIAAFLRSNLYIINVFLERCASNSYDLLRLGGNGGNTCENYDLLAALYT